MFNSQYSLYIYIYIKSSLKQALPPFFLFLFYCFISLSHALCSELSSFWLSSLSLPLSYDVVFMSAAFDNCQVETDSFNYFSKDPLFFMKRHLFCQNYLLLAHRSHGFVFTCQFLVVYMCNMCSLLFPVCPLINLYEVLMSVTCLSFPGKGWVKLVS